MYNHTWACMMKYAQEDFYHSMYIYTRNMQSGVWWQVHMYYLFMYVCTKNMQSGVWYVLVQVWCTSAVELCTSAMGMQVSNYGFYSVLEVMGYMDQQGLYASGSICIIVTYCVLHVLYGKNKATEHVEQNNAHHFCNSQ